MFEFTVKGKLVGLTTTITDSYNVPGGDKVTPTTEPGPDDYRRTQRP